MPKVNLLAIVSTVASTMIFVANAKLIGEKYSNNKAKIGDAQYENKLYITTQCPELFVNALDGPLKKSQELPNTRDKAPSKKLSEAEIQMLYRQTMLYS